MPTDGCSWIFNGSIAFSFKSPCERHDFGNRNFKHQGRETHNNEVATNGQFYLVTLDL